MNTPLDCLRAAYGEDADFRDGQLAATESALAPGSRTLVVQRTGWGKSVVYFVATRMLRDRGEGPTLLISPLLALMRNQMDTAQRFKVRAMTMNSTNVHEWAECEKMILTDQVDLVLVSPERLGNPRYAERLLPVLESRVALLVIDEAHCISDWGHDFRPDYRRILSTVNRLPTKARVLGTTATANDRVIDDIRRQFGARIEVQRGPLMRESLEIEAHEMGDQAERLAWLAEEIPRIAGSGIIYTLTINDCRQVAQWLRLRGVDAHAYHSDLPNEERVGLEEDFFYNRVKCLVATTALGMGYDKPDVSFVIHFQRPGTIIGYYQQIGRAGRSFTRARVVLLTGREDDEISDYFIRTAFPSAECFREVLAAVADLPRNNLDILTSATNQRRAQVEKALKILEVEGVLAHGEHWRLVRDDWQFSSLRVEQITQQRRQELAQMQAFVSQGGCRMAFLARSLDDPLATDCGRCDRCAPREMTLPPRALVLQAITFLRGDHPVIPVKKMYPAGVVEGQGRKSIPSELRLSEGICLCVYNDAGWGRLVREGKYGSHAFSDELVHASAALVRAKGIRAEWVAWVPSLRRPELVASFARRLAAALGVEAVEVIRKVADHPEQKAMENSTRQYMNVLGAFEAEDALVRKGTCLLVDDVKDSGWTLTATGMRLRQAGCSEVIPFTLATATTKE